jgi:hypothetical protein
VEWKTFKSEKGFAPLIFGIPTALLMLLIVICLIVLGPAVLISLSPGLKLLFQIVASVIILSWVRNTVGPGMISLVISAILIYIFVFTLPALTASMWALYMVMGLGLWSMIFWGMPLIFSSRR